MTTTNTLSTIVSSINSQKETPMTTQIESLIAQGKDRLTNFDAARSWLSVNLPLLPSISVSTLTQEQWYTSTVFGLATEFDMSASGILRLITTHSEELEMPDTSELKESALMVDARKVMNALKDAKVLNTRKTKRTIAVDGEEVTYYTHTATTQFKFSLEMFLGGLRDKSTMVCKPLDEKPTDWTRVHGKVRGPGNLTAVKGQSLVTSAVLEALNKVQAVAFRYNEDILDLVDDMLTNGDYEDKETERTLLAIDALSVKENNCFYFPVTFDFRGRMYYRGGLLTPQGEKIVKALLEFHEGVALGKNGMKWLTIHLANVMGADKKSIKNRLKYVADNHDAIMDIEDHDDMCAVFPDADKFTSLVAVLDYQRAYNSGNPEEYVSHLILHIDGTNNGLQHASVITKDRDTADAVNITASTELDEVRDLYDDVVTWALDAKLSTEARTVLQTHGRDLGKPVVMLKGYGAGDVTTAEGIDKVYKKKNITLTDSVRKEVADAIIKALDTNAGAVSKLVKCMKRLASKAGVNTITWVTADGFKVHQEYKSFDHLEVKIGDLSVRLVGEGEEDLIKAQTALAPNFVHSMDATHLRLLARRTDAPLALVHDSVGAHAGNMHEVSIKVRETFVELHQFDQMASIVESLGARKAPKFKGTYEVEEALKSAYIFS